MISALLLSAVIVGIGAQNVCKKEFNNRASGGAFTFSALSCFVSLLFFVVTLGGSFNYELGVLWYSLGFSASYALAVVFTFFAISAGPISLTALVNGYSLIIPTLYGLLILGEPVKPMLFVGLGLLAVSLLLVNLGRREQGKKVNLRWGIFVLLSFIGNGVCSAVQKAQQIAYAGAMKNEFMIVALAVTVSVLAGLAALIERKAMPATLKKGAPWYTVSGIANGGVNYLVMLLSASMSASVRFPIMSAGGIILSSALSLFLYREKFTSYQFAGILLGIGAIVVLSL